ncbi:hypothetical protein IF2G_04147 [Cordyceps javanica]|nr:hypothetical protein IF2G_04147 [Cordyceps javanica]
MLRCNPVPGATGETGCIDCPGCRRKIRRAVTPVWSASLKLNIQSSPGGYDDLFNWSTHLPTLLLSRTRFAGYRLLFVLSSCQLPCLLSTKLSD